MTSHYILARTRRFCVDDEPRDEVHEYKKVKIQEIREALTRDSIDDLWARLSTEAEDFIGLAQSKGRRRHQPVRVLSSTTSHRPRLEHEPVGLRHLRRVLRRVEELLNGQSYDNLRARVTRDLSNMSTTWKDLEGFNWDSCEQAAPALKAIIERLEKTRCETESIKWKERINDNTGYIYRWLADIEKERHLEGGATLMLEEAIADWKGTWSSENPYDCGPDDDMEEHINDKLEAMHMKLSAKVDGGGQTTIRDLDFPGPQKYDWSSCRGGRLAGH